MRRASSKVVQERPGDTSQGETAGEGLGFLGGSLEGGNPFPSAEPPLDYTDEPSEDQEFENSEAQAQGSVLGFNESQADEDGKQSASTGEALGAPAVEPFLGFDSSQLSMLVGGGVLLVVGGLVMLSKLSNKNKKRTNTYREPAERVDPEKKVRGQFKPSERFKNPKPKPESEPESSLGDLPAQVGVSNLVTAQEAQDALPSQVQPTLDGEVFDISADMDNAEFELFESDELVELESETPEVPNSVGPLSTQPPESHQDSSLSFDESPDSLNSHLAQSSNASADVAEPAYRASSKGDIHQEKPLGEDDEGVFGESGQELVSESPEEGLAVEAVGQSEVLVEQKIKSRQSAPGLSDESIAQQPVRANSEGEEAVMNLQDDDSELEFDFDPSEETEIGDSDDNFNFELDDDEVVEVQADPSADDVDFSDIELDESAIAVVDEVAEPLGDAIDAAGGISNAAKATTVAAGTAGAAAGGGILAKLFGWGKNKDAAELTEEALSETTEQISEVAENVASPVEQTVDETFAEVTNNASDIADDADAVGSAVETEFSLDDDGEIEIFAEAADDEFDFADDTDLAQAEIDDGEFSFVTPEPDADLDEGKKGFSSMDTLREPQRPVAGFSSADTIREPEKVTEDDSTGPGIAALGGTLAAGAAAAFALNTSPASPADLEDPAEPEEPAESVESQPEPVSDPAIFDRNSDEEAAADTRTSELEAKIEELQQANQRLREFAKTLEGQLESNLAQSEKALQDAEQEHAAKLEAGSSELSELTAKLEESSEEKAELKAELAAKLEASSTKESELVAELDSVKSELSQAKIAAEEAAEQAALEAAKASSEKQADLEKLRAELESAQSNTTTLNDELKSVKQQLADALANQASDDEGMPTGSLAAAAGLGALGLGAAGLAGDTSEAPSASAGDYDDLKKRFESRLKAERQARKDAQAHLEQAEQQRNEIANTLRGLKKEMAEFQSESGQSDTSQEK